MLKILVSILLQSFPETLVLLAIGLTLIGYNLKDNIKNMALLSIIFSIISYIVNSMSIPYGLNTLIQLPILIILAMLFLKLKLRGSITVILFGITILILFEGINLAIFSQIFNINPGKISNNAFLRTTISYIHLSLLVALIYFLKKKDITILPMLYNLKSKKHSIYIIINFLILILSFLTILIYFSLFVTHKGILNFISTSEEIRFLNLLLLVFLIAMSFIIKKLVYVTENNAIVETQEIYLKNLNELHNSFRALRHDFSNQVQILNVLLNNNDIEEAKKYIASLCQNINSLNKAVHVKNPVITALLQTKIALAETSGIPLTIDIKSNFDDLNITDMEFSRIIGNLIDNAFESTINLPAKERSVKLKSSTTGNLCIIEISNTGDPIPPEMIKHIFSGGVSTKNNHSGLGLTIVKKIIGKCKGDIGIKSNNKSTIFTIVIPLIKKKNL